jgi:hydroxyacylglutathione hydrolase
MSTRTPDVDFASGVPQSRDFDVCWIHGSPSAKHNTDPDIQVYAYDEHTFVLRQNMAINYEAPFMFVLFGNSRAVLIDTGATSHAEFFPLRRTVDDLVQDWVTKHRRDSYPLLVLHTHPHGDHTAGDSQFAKRPDTEVVDAELAGAWEYFGFRDAPDAISQIDLGGRVLECFATPGHHEAAVTFYDPYTGLLLTGDTVYPGRLYVQDWADFDRTIDRLIEFCEARPVTHIVGCHIEMSTTPGLDYPIGATYQPEEPPLELTVNHLRDIRDALDRNHARPGRYVLADLVLCQL